MAVNSEVVRLPKRSIALVLGAFLACVAGSAVGTDEAWQAAKVPLMTRWGKALTPASVLPEYPRPQMVRAAWQNLNGLWDYAVTAKAAEAPKGWQGKILVPFAIESALSGVHKGFDRNQRLWYHRTFDVPKEWAGQRVLLHFGAVDWEAAVTVNGKAVGTHRGGYDAFAFDITDALTAAGTQELVVNVLDATGDGQAKGKQTAGALAGFGTLGYCSASGIWQTVWLEPVPQASVRELRITPDIDAGVVRVKVLGRGTADGDAVEAVASDGTQQVAKVAGKVGDELTLAIPKAKLWSPGSPFLYDLSVTLRGRAGQPADEVRGYFGMRKIALGKDDKGRPRMMLNGEPVVQIGPLDQGYWPDGIYTAPSDEALRYDIEMTRKLGFNATRKHVKVEPDRWYYWCDKLGLPVWQDMPAGGGKDSPAAAKQFEAELRAMVEGLGNHPSVVMWVIFNEGWGQYDVPRLTEMVRGLDPSRLIDSVSCIDKEGNGDVIDDHPYWVPQAPKGDGRRAVVMGEFGGRAMVIPGHLISEEHVFGHPGGTILASPWEATVQYVQLVRHVHDAVDRAGLSGAICTQLTDIEGECNGFLTYDREVVKMDLAQVAAANAGRLPPIPEFRVLSPTAQKAAVTWRYTFTKPADDWAGAAFDDSAWPHGPGGFGIGAWRTKWDADDIWLRREFTLDAEKLSAPELSAHHDRFVEVYINGVLASKMTGYTIEYQRYEIRPDARATLKPGKNILAVHCRRIDSGRYIDVGVVDPK
jgi:hypothetical protein